MTLLKPQEQLHQVLAIYVSRSNQLFHLLQQVDAEDGSIASAFQTQRAAFHNFVALENRMARGGFDISLFPELQVLGREAEAVSAKLRDAIAEYQHKITSDIESLSRGRRSLRAYQSGVPQHHRFVKFT